MAGARGDQVEEIVRLAGVGRLVGVLGEPGIGVSTVLDQAAEALPGAVRRTGALRSLTSVPHLPLRRAFGVDPAEVDVAEVARRDLGGGTLVIDDLQWADPGTLARLEELAGAVIVLVGLRTGDGGTAATQAVVAAAGGTIVRLAPLDDAASASLARSIRPDLDEPGLDRAVAAAAGNPLVLHQLLRRGEVASSLADALAAEAASLPLTALVALAALSECPEGLPPGALDPHLGRLVDDGFVSHEGGVARARHQVVAVSAFERLDRDGQAAARRLAASNLTDAGRRAHLLAAAGDEEAALPLALEAASGAAAGARHQHLAVAARCATGPQQAALLVDALDAAEVAWDRPAARCLADEALAGPCSADPMVRVAAAEAHARDAASKTALSTLATIADPRPEVRARVHATRALALAWPRWDGEGASTEAASARSVIDDRRAASGAAVAALVLGNVEHDPSHLPEELRPLAGLWAGSAADAASLVPDFGPPTDREVLLALVAFHATGECDTAAVRLSQVRDVAERAVDRELLTAHLAIALADSGRTAAAAELALEGLAGEPSDVGRAHLLWALVEAEVAGGRLVRAAQAAEQAAVEADSPARCLARLTASWAVAIAPGGDGSVPPPPAPSPWIGLRAVVSEHAALAVARTNGAEAAAGFQEAAELWAPWHRRGELRCRWAAADARRADDPDAAVQALQALESEAADLGQRPLVARIRGSLRSAGVRTRPSRGHGRGPLSAREVEVLELVRLGFTTLEAAQSLGVASSTVETQVESAMRKLDARTRVQAAARLVELST